MKTWLLLLLGLGIVAAGCYTVVVHPQTSGMETSESPRHCSDCHNSADYYYWHFPYLDTWYWRYSYWRSYYCRPWWWDDYWWWDDSQAPKWEAPRYYEDRRSPQEPGLPGGAIRVKPKKSKGEEDKSIRQDTKQAPEKPTVPNYYQNRKRPKAESPSQPKKKKKKEKAKEGN